MWMLVGHLLIASAASLSGQLSSRIWGTQLWPSIVKSSMLQQCAIWKEPNVLEEHMPSVWELHGVTAQKNVLFNYQSLCLFILSWSSLHRASEFRSKLYCTSFPFELQYARKSNLSPYIRLCPVKVVMKFKNFHGTRRFYNQVHKCLAKDPVTHKLCKQNQIQGDIEVDGN